MMELFDVLDENGMYTGGIANRQICHEEGMRHKAVAVFIINSKNQVLLQRRSEKKKMWPGLWDISAGGHVLTGEFGYQAAIREVKEEIGIDITEKDMIFIGATISETFNSGYSDRHFNEYYIVKMDIDETKLVLQEEEVSDIIWMDKDEIINRINNHYNCITSKSGCWEYLIKYYEMSDKK